MPREIAWAISGGFRPSFAKKGGMLNKFKFATSPRVDPVAVSGIRPISFGPAAAGAAGKSAASLAANLKKTLSGATARYALRGNFVWWQSGMGQADIEDLARSLYAVFQSDIGPDITQLEAEAKEIKKSEKYKTSKGDARKKMTAHIKEGKAQVKADAMINLFNNIFKSYQDKETDLVKRGKEMIKFMINHQFNEEELEDFSKSYWVEDGKMAADITEEEWKVLNESDLLSGKAGFEKPGETIGDAEKIDMRGWIKRDGKKVKLAFDVTEDFLTTSEAAKSGAHGLGTALFFGEKGKNPAAHAAGGYEWVGKNQPTVREAIAKHFSKEIKDFYNPIVKDIKEYLNKDQPGGSSMAEKLEKYEPKYMPGQSSASLSSDIVKGGVLANTRTAGLLNNWISEQLGYGSGGRKDPKKRLTAEQKKQTKLVGYVQHNMKNINNMVDTEFSQMHKVTKRGRLGDAWYASVPMSLFPVDDKREYEFRRKDHARTPMGLGDIRASKRPAALGGTALLHGPRASLALLVKEGVINAIQARLLQGQQAQVNAIGHMHMGTTSNNSDGASVSLCNAASLKQGHATTVAYAPTILPRFFADFMKKMARGDEKDLEEIRTAAYKALDKHATAIPNALFRGGSQINVGAGFGPGGGSVDYTTGLWALPYVTMEDSLERTADEAYTWMTNKASQRKRGGGFR
tara:strand:- start:26 stop:2086 length:2061 start_codon:yes stop_codon:yes gene_type:complete